MASKTRLRVDILTIFPDKFKGIFDTSLIQKARKKRIIDIRIIDIRRYAIDKHHTVDDRPFGGGAGMVMKVGPIVRALSPYRKKSGLKKILLSPQGGVFNQEYARKLSRGKHLVLVCGHYEGIDERIRYFVDEEISIGDYVLTGGEIPAIVIVDSVARLIPGVVKERASVENDSFFTGRLDYPHYTRPNEFCDMRVPEVLVSGNHERIRQWRKKISLLNTLKKRPDLTKSYKLTEEEKKILKDIKENNL